MNRRNGFSLIEVILALAIFAGALAVLGEIWWLANRSAAEAAAETQAALLAESLLDRALAAGTEVTAVSRQPVETAFPASEGSSTSEPRWLYSLSVEPLDDEGLERLEVVVEQDLEAQFNPVKFRLVRRRPAGEEIGEALEESQLSQAVSGGSSGGAAGGATGS